LGFSKRTFFILTAVGFSLTAMELPSARAASEKNILLAHRLYQRLSGTRVASTAPQLVKMADLIESGKVEEAAAIATQQRGFISAIVFQMAAEISDLEGTRRSGVMSESVARIIAVVARNQPIRNILIERELFPVVVAPACAALDRRRRFSCAQGLDLSSPDVLNFGTTRHYAIVDSDIRVPTLVNGVVRAVPKAYFGELPNDSEDVAGIFTDMGFGQSTLLAGTNRRVIQQIVQQLWGLSLDSIRSQIPSDQYVRGDVSRNPEGTGSALYINQCKTCHSIIDPMSSAFARLDANDDNLLYRSRDGGLGPNGRPISAVVGKYLRNIGTFPLGYRVESSEWRIQFTPEQLEVFGWTGALQGRGVNSFAVALSQTKQFYRGMIKKVISLVCPNLNPDDEATAILKPEVRESLATALQSHQNLRRSFETVAARPECLGR
jgi:hypothetical protein